MELLSKTLGLDTCTNTVTGTKDGVEVSSKKKSLLKKLIIWAGGSVWLTVTLVGMLALAKYANEPGDQSIAPTQLPARFALFAGNSMSAEESKFTLILFAHPKCPCTKASIRQLARITAVCNKHLTTYVCFFQPKDFPSSWHQTNLWNEAKRNPSCEVVIDLDGELAKSCGASTSGTTLLFRPDEKLAFSGGITPGRGHEGDNAGSDAIIGIVHHQLYGRYQSPVFGCPLLKP